MTFRTTVTHALRQAFVGLIAIVMLVFTSSAMADSIFVKIGDIKGESMDKDHKEWIVALDWHWAMSRPESGATMVDRTRGTVGQLDHLTFTHFVDRASPKLMELCMNGRPVPKALITIARPTTDAGRVPYLRIELDNVIVMGMDTSGSGANEARPFIEEVSLSFTKFKFTYVEFDNRGMKRGEVEAGWDLLLNKSS